MNSIQLPFLITVEDYHEFAHLEKMFSSVDKDIRVCEVGFSDEYKYIGVVYNVKSVPSENDIDLLMIKQDIHFDETE